MTVVQVSVILKIQSRTTKIYINKQTKLRIILPSWIAHSLQWSNSRLDSQRIRVRKQQGTEIFLWTAR